MDPAGGGRGRGHAGYQNTSHGGFGRAAHINGFQHLNAPPYPPQGWPPVTSEANRPQGTATGNRGGPGIHGRDLMRAGVMLFLCGLYDLFPWLDTMIQPIILILGRRPPVLDTESEEDLALEPWLRVTAWVPDCLLEIARWIAGWWPCRVLLFIMVLMLRCYIRAVSFMLRCATWPARFMGQLLAL